MNFEEYEKLVAEIIFGMRQSAPELGSFLLGTGRTNRLRGWSGYKHQIDVSLSGSDDVYLIECKAWKRKVGVREVMVLGARATDIAQLDGRSSVQAILVSEIGATRGAKELARHFGVQLEIVRSAQEFGMRIGKDVAAGIADGIASGDAFTCVVVPATRETGR